jgi:membrane associated rhomboid family serine protease
MRGMSQIPPGQPAPRSSWRGTGWPDWPVALLTGAILAAFALQWLTGLDASIVWGGVSRETLREGRWFVLVSNIFLHGGVFHVGMNAYALVVLGRPVSARFGTDPRGGLVQLLLFLVCGLAGGLAFLLIHADNGQMAVGASGAIFGLWGAAARLADRPVGLSPLLGPFVRRQVIAAVVSNLILIVPLAIFGALTNGGGIQLAWEAHLGGFLFGLLFIGPFLRLAGRG